MLARMCVHMQNPAHIGSEGAFHRGVQPGGARRWLVTRKLTQDAVAVEGLTGVERVGRRLEREEQPLQTP